MKIKKDLDDGLFQVTYDQLHISHDSAQYDYYKSYRQVRDEYFQGKIKDEDAFRFLEHEKYLCEKQMYELVKPVDKQGGKKTGSKVNEENISFWGIREENFPKYASLEDHRNRIEIYINEIETAEAKKGGDGNQQPKDDIKALSNEIKEMEDAATVYLIKNHFIESRGNGIPSTEPPYRLCKNIKVPDVYRELVNAKSNGILAMDIAYIENYMRKTMTQYNPKKTIDKPLSTFLNSRSS